MDKKLVKNARKPEGEFGEKILERMNKSHESLAQWGVSHLQISPTDIILDVGCGGGKNIKRFAELASEGKIYGLDYSEVSVNKSKELNKEEIENGKVEIEQGSVSQLPYGDETFDLVTCFETVYFWPDFIEDLKEVHRVLKNNGSIFICNEAGGADEDKELMKEHIELLQKKEPSNFDNIQKFQFNSKVVTKVKERSRRREKKKKKKKGAVRWERQGRGRKERPVFLSYPKFQTTLM